MTEHELEVERLRLEAEVWLGVDAEQETLEDIAQPITAEN